MLVEYRIVCQISVQMQVLTNFGNIIISHCHQYGTAYLYIWNNLLPPLLHYKLKITSVVQLTHTFGHTHIHLK